MPKLANFRIETDTIVWLQFTNGTEQRLSRRVLAKHLEPADVAKVRDAYALRRDFLRTHMPKIGMVVLIIGAAAMVWRGPAMWHRASQLLAPPPHSSVPASAVKAAPVATPTPTASPTATPVPTPSPVAAAQPSSLHLAPSQYQGVQSIVSQGQDDDGDIVPPLQPATNLLNKTLAPVVEPVHGLLQQLL